MHGQRVDAGQPEQRTQSNWADHLVRTEQLNIQYEVVVALRVSQRRWIMNALSVSEGGDAENI
jgi:hypothetical protein